MAEKLAPLQLAELPARQTPFWKMTGPGAVLVGLSIGGGELVVWPLITAEFGASMVWAAALGIFIQLWVNFEIGRWTIATGESLYTGYSRIWRGFAHCFIFFNVAGWILPAWARKSHFSGAVDNRGPCDDPNPYMISAMAKYSRVRFPRSYTDSEKVSYAMNFHINYKAAQMRVIRRRRNQTPIAATRLFALRKKPANRRRSAPSSGRPGAWP